MDAEKFIIGFAIICGVIFWIMQFRSLLLTPKEHFSFEENKLIWGIAIVVLGIPGAILYWLLRPRKSIDEAPSPQEAFECMNCGNTIPKNATKCPHCSWTWY